MIMKKHGLLASTALIASLAFSGTASAQVDEIIVTASKRVSTLQDTPIAMSAITAESIEKSHIQDIKDLQSLVPSLTIQQFAQPSGTSFNIRGIGTSGFNAGLEPAVGVFIDGVYRARVGSALNDFIDIERVEVLRGPQSTIYGKNTPAGVVSIISKRPQFEMGAVAEATLGNYNSRIFKGSITGPVGNSESVAFRISGTKNDRDGFIENVATGEDVNNRDRYSLKAQLLIEPRDNITIRLIGDIAEVDQNCCAAPFVFNLPQNAAAFTALGANILPADPFARQVAFDNKLLTVNETSGLSAEINIDFDGFDLTSISAYRHFDEVSDIDADFIDVEALRIRQLSDSFDTFTQEIRVASTGENTIDWMLGGYFFTQDLDHANNTFFGNTLRPFADLATSGLITGLEGILGATRGVAPGTLLGAGTGQDSQFNQSSTSYAGFVNLDWHATEKLTVSGGLRYTKEDKDVNANISTDLYSQLKFVPQDPNAPANDFVDVSFETGLLIDGVTAQRAAAAAPGIQADNTSPLFGAPIAVIIGAITPTVRAQVAPAIIGGLRAFQFFPTDQLVYNQSRSEDNVSGHGTIAYEFTDTLNAYAKYSRGFKAGGFNLSAGSRLGSRDFRPEEIEAFEIGVKAKLFDNRVRVSSSIFDQKLNDFQANIFNGATFDLNNAGKVSIRGIEWDILAQPTDELTVTFGGTFLDHEYAEFDNGPCAPLAGSSGCTGQPVSFVSDLILTSTGTYTMPIGENFEGFVRADARYLGNHFSKGDLIAISAQPNTITVGASAGIGDEDGNWDLSVWGRNIFNEEYLQGVFNSVGQPGSFNGYPNNPPTYGVTLRVRR